ncbi:MAG: GH92 family glycosyl hydrolase [Anaerolineae bacterium]|nr:GH92 family glycosyl hydrolase [Anaerolineae bacterium]
MNLEYVNPNIGGIGHLLKATYPTVYRPHGMVGVTPQFDPAVNDRYLADHIHGFPVPVHLHRNGGNPQLMPVTGSPLPVPEDCASFFDHDFEIAAPHRYEVLLERYDITAEFTTTRHGVVYRFTFPQDRSPCLLLAPRKATIDHIDDTSIEGHQDLGGDVTGYFNLRLDQPVAHRDDLHSGIRFHFTGIQPLEARIGVSLIDAAQARRNLERELGDRTFDQLAEEAKQEWEAVLAQIRVEGGSATQRRTLYTALYRYMGRMQNITEEGRYFSAYDGRVHTGEPDFYVTDQIWDTFRSAHPLRLLIDPQRELDMLRSYVRMATQSGWLPRFPMVGGDVPCMLGHHTIAALVDAYRKGLTDFDVEAAYALMLKTVTGATKLPWRNGPLTDLDRFYMEEGYLPALAPDEEETVPEVHPFERRQAVAVSLECCYDEYVLGQMASKLGRDDDAATFLNRAGNYRKLYNPANGFVAPRGANGAWIEPFDPKLSGGQGGRAYYAECNAWTYTWSVQHDVAGLIDLMGGREAFVERLDQLFIEPCGNAKYHFLGQFPDSTGLIGQFVTGNEPSFHIPYLYNWAGAPWKTQRRVRQIMDIWFDDTPLGLCGDEDGGAMSAWHIFNAIGFFPTCPGEPYYALGSPVFERIELHPPDGPVVTINAEGSSPQNKYIHGAELNGKPHDRPWFLHEAIQDGGELTLMMGPRPNKAWGSRTEDAPPSLSDGEQR